MSAWWSPDAASSSRSVEDQILDRTEEWHTGGPGTDCSLYRYLGMTFHEGKRWVETGVYPQHLIHNDIKPGSLEMHEYFRHRLIEDLSDKFTPEQVDELLVAVDRACEKVRPDCIGEG